MFEYEKYKVFISRLILILIAFYSYLFKWSDDISFMLSQVTFIAYSLGILFVLRSNLFKYIFEPPVFFLLFTFIYEVLKFPYYFGMISTSEIIRINLLPSRFKISNYYETSFYLLLFQSFCISILLITYARIKKPIDKVFNIDSNIYNDKPLVVFATLTLVFGFLRFYYITGGNLFYLLTRRTGNTEAGKLLSENYILSLCVSSSLACIPMILALRYFYKKKFIYIIPMYAIALTLSYFVTGGRGPLVYSLLACVILFLSKQKSRLPLIKLSSIALIIIIVFSLLGLIRRSMNDTNHIVSNIKSRTEIENKWYTELSTYQLQFRDETVFATIDRVGLSMGETYLNLITFPFPRSIMGDLKPRFLDLIVEKEYFKRDNIGLPLTCMSESFLNFGYLGCIVFLFWGILMGKISNYLLTKGSLFSIIFSLAAFVFIQTWTTTYIVYFLQFSVLASIALMKVKQSGGK